MTQESIPYDNIAYSDSQWRKLLRTIYDGFPNRIGGIFDSNSDSRFRSLQIIPTSPPSFAVNVLPGACLINGLFYNSDKNEIIRIPKNTSTNFRIDTIAIRVDYTGQKARIVLKIGEPGDPPVAEKLSNTASLVEMALAYIKTDVIDAVINNVNIEYTNIYLNSQNRSAYLFKNSTSSIISQRTPVEIDSSANNSVKPAETVIAIGISLEDIPSGSFGLIGTRGDFYAQVSERVPTGSRVSNDIDNPGKIYSDSNLSGFIGQTLESGLEDSIIEINVSQEGLPLLPIVKDARSFWFPSGSIINPLPDDLIGESGRNGDPNIFEVNLDIENFGYRITRIESEWSRSDNTNTHAFEVTPPDGNQVVDFMYPIPEDQQGSDWMQTRRRANIRYRITTTAGQGDWSSLRRVLSVPRSSAGGDIHSGSRINYHVNIYFEGGRPLRYYGHDGNNTDRRYIDLSSQTGTSWRAGGRIARHSASGRGENEYGWGPDSVYIREDEEEDD